MQRAQPEIARVQHFRSGASHDTMAFERPRYLYLVSILAKLGLDWWHKQNSRLNVDEHSCNLARASMLLMRAQSHRPGLLVRKQHQVLLCLVKIYRCWKIPSRHTQSLVTSALNWLRSPTEDVVRWLRNSHVSQIDLAVVYQRWASYTRLELALILVQEQEWDVQVCHLLVLYLLEARFRLLTGK